MSSQILGSKDAADVYFFDNCVEHIHGVDEEATAITVGRQSYAVGREHLVHVGEIPVFALLILLEKADL